MHRAMDDFIDHHPVALRSKHRLRPRHGLYSGVLVDMIYDHLLAAGWENHHPENLETFSQQVYLRLKNFEEYFPERSKRIIQVMSEHNWLLMYRDKNQWKEILQSMSLRIGKKDLLSSASIDLEEHRKDFEKEFEEFFEEAKKKFLPSYL